MIYDAVGQNGFIVWGFYALLIGGVLISSVIRKTSMKTSPSEKSPAAMNARKKPLKFNRFEGD